MIPLRRIGPTRRALLALAVGSFWLATGEFVTLGLLPDIAGSLGISIPQAGNLIAAYALGVVVGAPLLTVLAVRMPRKGLLITLVLVLAAGNFGSAVSPGFVPLLVLRFVAGLPHGAYFGAASVVAAGMVEARRRSSAMAVVFAGLTIANIIGVPATTLLGQNTSWRVVFGLIGAFEVVAAAGILAFVPLVRISPDDVPRLGAEFRVFRNYQVWLGLAIATIGGGALFTTFSYIAPMMTKVAGYSASSITPLLVLFGVGMTAGNLVGARLADRALMPTVCGAMAAVTVIAALFFVTDRDQITAAVTIVAFPFAAMAMIPSLQSRLVTLAEGAPNLAAASMHSAFNIANSIGAWLGGLVIAAGYGYSSPNLVAAGLAAAGLVIALTSWRLDARSRPTVVPDRVNCSVLEP